MENNAALLRELERRLRATGTVAVPFRDHLEIRLPLFASVRVSIVDGQLVCDPRFGFVPRDRATWVTLIGIGVLTSVLLLTQGVTPISVMFGFLGVSSTGSTAIRYQLTESAITRIQMQWMAMTAGQAATRLESAPPALELGPTTAESTHPVGQTPTPIPRRRQGI